MPSNLVNDISFNRMIASIWYMFGDVDFGFGSLIRLGADTGDFNFLGDDFFLLLFFDDLQFA